VNRAAAPGAIFRSNSAPAAMRGFPGSYDPAANLIYWSTAQAKPWARAVRGTDGDALYTNSTLALDPDTGKINWYHQFLPGETQDMDEVFENILVNRGASQSVYKMGKLGVLWELDRKTGKFVSAHDLGYQNIVDIDPQTGKVTYRPGMIPEIGKPLTFCPSTAGFKDWRAMAYLPQTQAFYIRLRLPASAPSSKKCRAPWAPAAPGRSTAPTCFTRVAPKDSASSPPWT
jgi:alcohol dehydrogenase (cytochrome c)